MCVCVCVYVCANKKKQGFQKMILSVVELFANVKRFGFYLKLLSGHLNM